MGAGRSAEGTVDLAQAVEVFVRGFSFTRSFTHPYEVSRVGPVWVMRDAPRKRGAPRVEEWVACGVPPRDVDRIARAHAPARFAISVLHGGTEPDGTLRMAFRELGYRLVRTEALMAHRLEGIPSFAPPAVVERVETVELASALARAARARQILPEHLGADAPLRQYVARWDDELVGWVRSIAVGDATWCSNMYVVPRFRRRGIARAMLCRMLRDDRAAGAKTAVLLASHTGAKLYPHVGYEQIGTLLLFGPPKT